MAKIINSNLENILIYLSRKLILKEYYRAHITKGRVRGHDYETTHVEAMTPHHRDHAGKGTMAMPLGTEGP